MEHTENPTLGELRRAIPAHCFQPSSLISFGYLLRDILYATALVFAALQIPSIQNDTLQILSWAVYGFLQGLVGTGIWIIAHECGHAAFTSSAVLNDTVGWVLHSLLLVPYFSWKITHARHHRYTGHMEKDTAFVPLTEAEFAKKGGVQLNQIGDLMQDTSLMTLTRLIGHQLAGWQLYLFLYRTGGRDSIPEANVDQPDTLSHLDPFSQIFMQKQRFVVLISDLGIFIMGTILFYLGGHVGLSNILKLYFVPYLWIHHWIVAITHLHHTHPSVPHYSVGTWSFTKGALATVDRSFGLIGRHFFHDIIDHHVVHHLFPKIPFYKAEEATEKIKSLLGPRYISEKEEYFLFSLWNTFRKCQYVSEATGNTGAFQWKLDG